MFNIGDKVTICGRFTSFRGVIGTITNIYSHPDRHFPVQVEFQNGNKGLFAICELQHYIEVPVTQECISLTF